MFRVSGLGFHLARPQHVVGAVDKLSRDFRNVHETVTLCPDVDECAKVLYIPHLSLEPLPTFQRLDGVRHLSLPRRRRPATLRRIFVRHRDQCSPLPLPRRSRQRGCPCRLAQRSPAVLGAHGTSRRARVKPSPARPFCSANTGGHRTGEYCACTDSTRYARSLLRVPLGRRRQTRRCQPAQRARTGHQSLCRIGSARRRRTRCVRPRPSRGQARWRGALGGAPPKTRPRPASPAAASPGPGLRDAVSVKMEAAPLLGTGPSIKAHCAQAWARPVCHSKRRRPHRRESRKRRGRWRERACRKGRRTRMARRTLLCFLSAVPFCAGWFPALWQ